MPRRKFSNRLPPFVALTLDLLNSVAYKKLSPSAAKALPYFLGKVKLSYNNLARYQTPFTLSYPEAKDYGFSTGTFSRITKELESAGFIDIVEKGGLRGKGKSCNQYQLSRRWENYTGKDDAKISHQIIPDIDDPFRAKVTRVILRKIPSLEGMTRISQGG